MINTPVLFLVFNRPDTTVQVMDVIRKVKPPKLYIAADGPRAHIEGEAALCQETKEQVLAMVDWDCQVYSLFRELNLGCARAISSAIDWFFEQEELGIILEDDCLPNESFFLFCQRLLHHYKKDSRVMHISGFNDQDGISRGNASYFFSNYPRVWGWASWRRAWKHYQLEPQVSPTLETDIVTKFFYNHKKAGKRWFMDFYKLTQSLSTWDYQWCLSIWKQHGLSITPNVPLIRNIGFDGRGAHTTAPSEELMSIELVAMEGEIFHPEEFIPEREADFLSFNKHLYPNFSRRVALRSASLLKKVSKP